jgi:hypothetical protein
MALVPDMLLPIPKPTLAEAKLLDMPVRNVGGEAGWAAFCERARPCNFEVDAIAVLGPLVALVLERLE